MTPNTPQAGSGVTDAIRAAGGIVHRDGNIFFTNRYQFEHAASLVCGTATIATPPVGAGGAGVMDARPETMEIRYETFGNCLWHTDCKVNSFKSGVMQVLSHEKTSSTMKCLSCGQVGAYPKGRVGTVCVPVISTDAAILASKGGDQGEGK